MTLPLPLRSRPLPCGSAALLAIIVVVTSACNGHTVRAIPSVALPGGSTVGCTVQVTAGGDVAGAVANAGPGTIVCLASGTYQLRSTLAPATGTTIRGTGVSAPVIVCHVSYCFDGLAGGTEVTVSNLVLKDATNSDLRTNDGWTVTQVEAMTAGQKGFNLRGAHVVLRDSYAVADGEFGIVSKSATALTIDGVTVLDTPTDESFGIGFSGGIKLNGVSGALIQHSTVRDTQGGAAIWLDDSTQNFELRSNTVVDAAHDGIRIEISCRGTITGNTVKGAGNVGVDLFNANGVAVAQSIVSGTGTWGIRMLGNGRSTGPGGGGCLRSGTYPNAANTANDNQVTLDQGSQAGVENDGGAISDLSWSANRYTTASCDDERWQWWSGSDDPRASFADWQGFGQDTSGTCTSAPSS
jgi:parallel beta-helix repeat protein